jgi:hypothetical protein
LKWNPVLRTWSEVTDFAVQCAAGLGLSNILGLIPAITLDPVVNPKSFLPFSPTTALMGLILGYLLSTRIKDGRGSTLVWIGGLCWLAFNFYGSAKEWSPSWSSEKSGWAYAATKYFGRQSSCADECIGELFVTFPFVTSLTYSFGAFIRRLQKVPL